MDKDARTRYRMKAHAQARVANLVRFGKLPSLKKNIIACVDCGQRANQYEHRDYAKPIEVEPVCGRCNVGRGPGAISHVTIDSSLRGRRNGLRDISFHVSDDEAKKFLECAHAQGLTVSGMARILLYEEFAKSNEWITHAARALADRGRRFGGIEVSSET